MSLSILDQFGPRAARGKQPFAGELALLRGRVHELCGPARVAMAAMLMARTAGPVLWIAPAWRAERIYPDGLAGFADPGRLVMAQARRGEDILWAMEEALRSGALPLVVARPAVKQVVPECPEFLHGQLRQLRDLRRGRVCLCRHWRTPLS